MGIFDIFGTSDQQAAAQAQIAGLQQGQAAATGNINSGINALTSNYGNASSALTSNYTSALQPYLQNYNTANSGVTQLGNVLGLNGAAGNNAAMTALQNTPGYQFQLQQGDAALNAQAAATGQLASGNTALALSNYNQGLAGTTYNNYVSQLQPFLNQANTAASGIANTYTGLGSNLAGVSTGLGNATANQYGQLAGLNYQTATGIGNANANADLAGLTASGNAINAIGQGVKLATSIFSDERLKENIEPVGELYDGTNIYRYNYKGDDVPRIGVMAQEVEKTRPDAVTEIGGFKAVDYSKATDLAASLARFLDDNVVKLDDHRSAKTGGGYASDLSRFLEAA